MRKIIFIGPDGGGTTPYHGASFKNNLIIRRLRALGYPLEVVDTEYWRKDLKAMLKLALKILRHGDSTFVVSASRRSAYRFLRILRRLGVSAPMHYWVIGGRLGADIDEGNFKDKVFRSLASIIVESDGMKEELQQLGLGNVIMVPNFKVMPRLESLTLVPNRERRFLFLSRITKDKGCHLIFEAAEKLKASGNGNFTIDFYGHIAPEYKEEFLKNVESDPRITYKGFIDMTDDSNYRVLSEYDAMLLPTQWESEGFAGAIIDCFIAGVPVIASRWMRIPEVVKEGKTGWLIPPGDAGALADAMGKVMADCPEWGEMRMECLKMAYRYDIENVLTRETLSFLE